MEENNQKNETASNLIVNDTDWLLALLIGFVNGTERVFPVTLLMNGFLVSGDLVGGDRYFEHWINTHLGARPNDPEKQELHNFFESWKLSYQENDADQVKPIGYFHLFDAKFFQPNGRGIPSNGGIEFRGKLRDVSGFYIGKLRDREDEYVDLNPEETTPTAGNAS